MIYHQLQFDLTARTPGPPPKPLPLTSHRRIKGKITYNCSECMAPRSVIEAPVGYRCIQCGQKFYQTMLAL